MGLLCLEKNEETSANETVDSAGEVFPGKIGSSVVLQQINTWMYAGEGRIRMFPF